MAQLRAFMQERFWVIILLFVIGGFLAIAVELIFIGHLHDSQLVAVYAAFFGASVAIHGLMASERVRFYLAGALLLLSIMGMIGIFEHFGARKTKEGMALVQQMTIAMTEDATTIGGVDSANNSFLAPITSPPILAPLSLSGLSLLGMFTLFIRSTSNAMHKRPDD